MTSPEQPKEQEVTPKPSAEDVPPTDGPDTQKDAKPREVGGRGGLDPTRFGDWEKNGRCIDF